ncbi:MAG: glycoside hydrolase family 16 protein, partial [Bacteroidales bacterium]|nr:glycoside hydrolase family 16 protein [Bacteroidales bacterium]
MKRLLVFIMVGMAFVFSCSNDEQEEPNPTPTQQPESVQPESYALGDTLTYDGMKIVWQDEFNTGSMIDTTHWTYEKGYVRNGEIQYYTEARPENCRLEDGFLVITGRKETPLYQDSISITSASLKTQRKHSWQYGRFEIRAKVPAGKGPWPAFWAKGDAQNEGQGWPVCGEIDIMEYAAKDPLMIQNIIYGTSTTNYHQNYNYIYQDFSDRFYIYSLHWTETQIVFAIDNIVTHVVDITNLTPNPYHQPFSIL